MSSQLKSGLLLLFGLLILCTVGVLSVDLFVAPRTYDDAHIKQLANDIDGLWDNEEDADLSASSELFRFNPNTITADEWRALGIEDKVVRSIVNYKEKGGKFYRKEDVLRIYGITKDDYLRLAPYIQVPSDRGDYYSRYGYASRASGDRAEASPIEINTADSATWTSLRGIGPVLASRIVKYREKLRGFTDVNQVSQVYGVSSETFEAILPFLLLDSTLVYPSFGPDKASTEEPRVLAPVNLNTADSAQLDALAGIGGYSARKITDYGEQLGGYYSMEQLKEVRGLRPENIERFSAHLWIDTSAIVKLDLNHASHAQLKSHLYISHSLADFIVSYRLKTPFVSVENIRKSFLVDESLYLKLRPYLTCQP